MESFDPTDHTADADSGQDKARVARRESLFLGVDIKRDHSCPQGRIRNISPTGAFVEVAAAMYLGEHVELSFRGYERIGATIVRLTPKGDGVRFDHPVDPALCKRAVTGPGDHVPPGWAPTPRPVLRYPPKILGPRR